MEPSALANSIVNHEQLTTSDLINTLLLYLTGLTASNDDDQGYKHYDLCKPALLRLHAEDAVGFLRVAKKIKERLGDHFPIGVIKRDIELLSTAQAHAQQAQAAPAPPGLVVGLATAILDTDHFAQDAGGKLWVYSDGVYKPRGEQHIRRRVKELLTSRDESKKWSSHLANEVVEYIRTDAPELWERPPLDTINVLNGLLDVNTKTLRPHSPDWLSPVQLPVRFDPSAVPRAWDKFINDTFPRDARKLVYEIIADLMTPDRSEQKAVLLTGEGGNGKSTYLTATRNVLGRRNTVSLSLQKLETDRFAAGRLVGKLANICPDLPSTHLASTSMFKTITGGDTIIGEHKFRDSFDFTPYCRLVFSANRPPRSGDDSEAFFKRWLVVPFDRVFRGTKKEIPRRVLDARLADPQELSGVLNKALAVLSALRKRGFTVSESMRKAWEEFRQTTDPLSVWLEHNTIETPTAFVAKQSLRTAYNAYCERESQPRLSEKAFGQALRRLRPNIAEAQRTIAGKVTWVWTSIGLSTPADPPPAEPPQPPRSQDDSLDSLDSLDSSTRCAEAKKNMSAGTEGDKGQAATFFNSPKQSRENPVNPVNPVKDANGDAAGAARPNGGFTSDSEAFNHAGTHRDDRDAKNPPRSKPVQWEKDL